MPSSIAELLLSLKQSVQNARQRRRASRLSCIQILDEGSFLNVLCVERKRIERSGRHLILMLLEPGILLANPDKQRIFTTFIDNLLRSTRETDYMGWYKQDSVLGIIFVDVHDAGSETVREALAQKVKDAIEATRLKRDLHSEIRISLHLFPEPPEVCGADGLLKLPFYRDTMRDSTCSRSYRLVKRSLDVIASILGLLAMSPVFVAIAAVIKLTSEGPVLFRQERVGQHFKRFTFLKFRSMYADNNDAIHKDYVARFIAGEADRQCGEHGHVFKLTRDPRVTRIGQFLRRTSLDELPQLINVLQGHMTLVGPRPCTAYEFEYYKLWHRQRLLAVKPGITGLWQVTGRSNVEFDEMVRLDLAYAKARSFWLDLKILMKTPRAVIWGHGAC